MINEREVEPIKLFVNHDSKIRADKKTVLAGKKDITLGHYKLGQTVKVPIVSLMRRCSKFA
ncbi:MAG: hypothetical protein JWM21_4373 [Acidobacteria bacterium]|nr:hypothetical protein [Acidobacteriota bacterium]